MSCCVSIADPSVPETVVIRIDPAAGIEGQARLIQRMEPLLPHLNWRAHLFLISDTGPGQSKYISATIDALARFASLNPFVTYFVHPLIRIGSSDAAHTKLLRELLDDLRPMQEMAYQHQGEPSLQILPILEPEPGTSLKE